MTRGEWRDVTEHPRAVVLSFVVFALLFGQPAVVFALAILSPEPATFAVIGGGTVLLAAVAARAFVRAGGSVGRLGDFLLALAFVQIVLFAASQLLVDLTAGLMPDSLRPALVVLAYPVAWAIVYRGRRVSVFESIVNH